MTYVARDPFAREELHSTRVKVTTETCAWCGSQRQRPYDKTPWLYHFRVETDGGRTFEDQDLFCTRTCRAAYME